MARPRRAKRANDFGGVIDENDDDDKDFIDDVKLETEEYTSTTRASSISTTTTTPNSRARVESLRERMQLFYGSSDEELVRAIQIRAKWGNKLFTVTTQDLDLRESIDTGAVSPVVLSSLVETDPVKSGGFACVVDGVSLNPHETRVCENVAAILNVGYRVLSIDWSSTGLLAVAVQTTEGSPIDAPALFPTDKSSTLIYIYTVQGTQIKLHTTIYGDYGVAREVHWRPAASSGLELCVVCGNGQVGIVSIASHLQTKVVNLKLNPLVPVVPGSATCACWRTPDTLVIGYEDGFIAEFFVGTGADGTPSFVRHAHSSVVTALASGWPEYPAALFTVSVDGWSNVYPHVGDLRVVHRAPRLKFFASFAAYSSYSDSFISMEDNDTAKLVPWRKPGLVQAQTALTRHRSGIFAAASANSHPLILTGGQDGELHIANPLRRTMVTRRNRDIHMDCTLWRFECSDKTSEFRFVDVLEASTLPKRKVPSHLPIFPSSVTITSVKWKPNSTWYAAATASGIIRLENIFQPQHDTAQTPDS